MLHKILPISMVLATAAFPASLIQPSIDPDGVINAASYIRRGFQNSGIARGSLFLITGKNLGPETLVQATTFSPPSSDGLGGTRVHVDTEGYSAYALMIYTSARQVAAIMPSSMPEGPATITLNYNNLTSNPVSVRIVRSQPGLFTLNQAGSAQAIAQNWQEGAIPLNSLLTPAMPGKPVLLWSTGLGPVMGDDAKASNLYIDSLIVGGQQAKVTYSGRSSCCVGLDQIIFEVPANVTGCYVPVAVTSGGVTSNFATIAVSSDGGPCEDPLSFSSYALAAASRSGHISVGQINLSDQSPPAGGNRAGSMTGNFSLYATGDLLAAAAPVNPIVGSCYVTQQPVNADPAALSHSTALNAGTQFYTTGPAGLSAFATSPGLYFGDMTSGGLPEGPYGILGAGGTDIGEFRASFMVAPAIQWTNYARYAFGMVNPSDPLSLTWIGGDANSYVGIRIESSDGTYQATARCNVAASPGGFTVPDYVMRSMPGGAGTITLSSFTAPSRFAATGLDAGFITAGAASVLKVTFLRQ